jgi:spectinomycin phosphotransferase
VRERPAGITDPDLAAVLAARWRLAVTGLRYLPAGFGGYHWAAADSNGRSWFVTVTDLDGIYGPGLTAAMDTAADLAADGLDFVVAPVRTAAGPATARLGPSHAVTVFPLLDGAPGAWGDELSRADRGALTGMLAALHSAVPPGAAPARPIELARRDALDASLAERRHRWGGGPFAERARELLDAHSGELERALDRFDALASRVRQDGRAPAITHGEPHPGNLIRVGGRLLLIDWETAGLAPPERDLWWVAEEAATYARLTGRAISQPALDLYRLRWPLDDISLFLARMRGPHGRDADSAAAFSGLGDSLRALRASA